MADMLVNSTKLDACLSAEADAIRAKTGGTADLTFDFANDKGFADAIAAIPSGAAITDGIVVDAVDSNGNITAVTKYGALHPYEFGTGSASYAEAPYGKVQTVTLIDDSAAPASAFSNPTIASIIGSEHITGAGANCFRYATSLLSIVLPNARTFGNTCFRGIKATEVILPKFSTGGDLIFQSARSMANVQLGSVGFAVTAKNNQWFYDCVQQMTITVYTAGAQVDNMVTYIRRNATNATIIIKASEATTYNGTAYAAGDTILTSEVTA